MGIDGMFWMACKRVLTRDKEPGANKGSDLVRQDSSPRLCCLCGLCFFFSLEKT